MTSAVTSDAAKTTPNSPHLWREGGHELKFLLHSCDAMVSVARPSLAYVRAVQAAGHDSALLPPRVGLHDASRIEWSVSLPLPENGVTPFEIELDLRVPSNSYAQHSPWGQLQAFARLDAQEAPSSLEHPTLDDLRRAALALAAALTACRDQFRSVCRDFDVQPAEHERDDRADELCRHVESAVRNLEDARALWLRVHNDEAQERRRERRLADEYLSVRMTDNLGACERALQKAFPAGLPDALDPVRRMLSACVAREMAHRTSRGFLLADPRRPESMERYLARASQLKKHFQEILFLEADRFHVADRIHHWAAAVGALVASTWSVIFQVFMVRRATQVETTVNSGLVFLCVVAGIAYAGRDRIKEAGRSWISGRVHRIYAQRVTRYRAPTRRLSGRDVVAMAKESFDESAEFALDPLNPASGVTYSVVHVKYTNKGDVYAQPILSTAGVQKVKFVFRYDLSPLFARLDDGIKQVPVFDSEAQEVRLVDAPRSYRVPLTLTLRSRKESVKVEATLVLHKGGLRRIEFAESGIASDAEAGLDPT